MVRPIISCVLLGVTASIALVAAQGNPAAPPPGRGGLPRPEPYDFNDHGGWVSIFDGTLKDWEANPDVWHVENGVITAVSTTERRLGTTYIYWKGGELADFELKLEEKLEGDVHSGIAYRSWIGSPAPRAAGPGAAGAGGAGGVGGRAPQPPPDVPSDPRWMLAGPGCDFDADRRNSGNIEERYTPRRILATRGMAVRMDAGVPARIVGTFGDPDALMNDIKTDDWNQIHVIVRGHQFTNIINGRLMAMAIDDDPAAFHAKGLIGWSIEQSLGRVSVRNIWLKKL
jgi:hypothetical protein